MSEWKLDVLLFDTLKISTGQIGFFLHLYTKLAHYVAERRGWATEGLLWEYLTNQENVSL